MIAQLDTKEVNILWSSKLDTSAAAESSDQRGTKSVTLGNQSMNTQILVQPLEDNRSVMNFMEMWPQDSLGTGNERRGHVGNKVGDLFWAQTEHAFTYSSMCLRRPGH